MYFIHNLMARGRLFPLHAVTKLIYTLFKLSQNCVFTNYSQRLTTPFFYRKWRFLYSCSYKFLVGDPAHSLEPTCHGTTSTWLNTIQWMLVTCQNNASWLDDCFLIAYGYSLTAQALIDMPVILYDKIILDKTRILHCLTLHFYLIGTIDLHKLSNL